MKWWRRVPEWWFFTAWNVILYAVVVRFVLGEPDRPVTWIVGSAIVFRLLFPPKPHDYKLLGRI